jgi:calcineurin-like phosphoesterase family protein
MMQYWFLSDTHFSHANIIRYTNRPFLKEGDLDKDGNWVSLYIANQRVEEMNSFIIKRWNERVKDEDTVYLIGDFCFKSTPNQLHKGEGQLFPSDYFEKQLNGKIIFIKGSHDNNNSCKTCIRCIKIKLGGYVINLVHDPEHLDYSVPINIIGHVHNAFSVKRCYLGKKSTVAINVSADVTNFMPQTIEQILKRYQMFLKEEKIKKKEKSESK